MWKTIVAIACVLGFLGVIFYADIISALTGGSWKLDPSVPPWGFAGGLAAGLAALIWVFYVLLYGKLLRNLQRSPATSATIALLVTVGLAVVWIFVHFSMYYAWLNPAPDLADYSVLGGLYPYWSSLSCLLLSAVFGLLFWVPSHR